MDKSRTVIREILSTVKNDYDVSDIRTCVYWTAVCSLHCGLASTLAASLSPPPESQVDRAGNLLPSGAKDLAELSYSPRILEASIGLAAVNSLLCPDESQFSDLNAESELQTVGAGKRMAVIGHFPFSKGLRQKTKELWVFELPGRERPGDYSANDMENLLPEAEIVAITSTTLINHTLGRILGLISLKAYKMMLGPSTPLSPVLFDHGFDTIAGSIVTNPQVMLAGISQGANFRQVRGVRKVILRRK
jgi:hypothetical protein